MFYMYIPYGYLYQVYFCNYYYDYYNHQYLRLCVVFLKWSALLILYIVYRAAYTPACVASAAHEHQIHRAAPASLPSQCRSKSCDM